MIDEFSDWIESIREEYQQKGIVFFEVHSVEKNVEKRSIRVDFEIHRQLGRITLWETGESDIELLDIESEVMIDYKVVFVQEKTYKDVYVSYFESILK